MNKATTRQPDISIVIVNYHSWDKLRRCLDSLSNDKQPESSLQIIVVNNDPTDTRINDFSRAFAHVEFVNNSGNLGFAHGCNTGALRALADTLLFLNPDTRVPANAISNMLKQHNMLPAFSILATHKRTPKGKLERTTRFFPSPLTVSGLGKAIHRMCNRRLLRAQFNPMLPIVNPDWVSGCVVMINKQNFVELGGWDTRYWMYSEDADICKRATNKGGKIALFQEVCIEHDHGGSTRINPVTTALTKTEVQISHHVFVELHFTGFKKWVMHTQFAMFHLLSASFWALLSLLFLRHKKAISKRLVWRNLCAYYIYALTKRTWLSPRSVGQETRF